MTVMHFNVVPGNVRFMFTQDLSCKIMEAGEISRLLQCLKSKRHEKAARDRKLSQNLHRC